MRDAILVYEAQTDFDARTDPSRRDEYWGSRGAYSQFRGDRITGGAALQGTETATTIRLRDGERRVEDGPFADTKERLGGFYLVEANDLDEALALAAKAPSAVRGSVEAERLGIVCEAIYATFTAGREDAPDAEHDLVDEAIWLGRLVHAASDEHPETAGPLARMLHVAARRAAQRGPGGGSVPLDRQDVRQWDRPRIAEVHGPEAAYTLLRAGDEGVSPPPRAYWALRAHLEARTGRDPSASVERAAAASDDPAVRAFLRSLDPS